MKKLRIAILFLILAFSFSVKAEVMLEIDCNGKEISSDKSITCEGNLLYEKEGINDIEFNYQTNLDINFLNVTGFTITNSNGKVSIHTDKALYDEIMNATKIMEFTLSMNDKVGEKEQININNIMINKSRDIKVGDVSQEFTVVSTNNLDNVCTLDSISIDGKMITGFSKDKLEYHDIYVNNEIVFIDAIRTSNKSSATGLGNVKVPKGDTITRSIIVTAEDGTNSVYKLYITNVETNNTNLDEDEVKPDEEMKSIDNTLKSLEILNGKDKIDIDFDIDKEIYNIEINDEIDEKIAIKAELNNSKASFVKGFGPRDINIKYGYNKEFIKIKAESGDERVITLNINYLDNRNKDNTLLSLTINGQIVDLTKEKLEVTLPNTIDKTDIEAIPNNEKSTVKFENIDLVLGDNEVVIEVTSEDGETSEYDVNVIREEKKVLENITIEGYNLGFTKDKTNYDLKVNNDTKELIIKINPSEIPSEILNNQNIQNGTKVIIKIIDDDGVKEYTINIIKDSNYLINIVCYLVFGIGVISLIASIIYVMKKKK